MNNILSLEAALAWARSKPSEEYYNYWSIQTCACGQYASHIGVERWSYRTSFGTFWDTMNAIASDHPHTFGGLARRLECHLVAAKRIEQP